MSSFVGHALAAWTVGIASPKEQSWPRLYVWLWLVWLVIVAWMPDCDNAIPALHPRSHNGLRITHTVLYSQILPVLTLLYLHWRGVARSRLRVCGIQLVLVGLSHLILDLLVGVTPLPLFWPINNHLFKLPFGLLPSAGKISLSNPYFLGNLKLEMGVLLPLSSTVVVFHTVRQTWFVCLFGAAMVAISGHFMAIAYHLVR